MQGKTFALKSQFNYYSASNCVDVLQLKIETLDWEKFIDTH